MTVNASGEGEGEGTHVTVYACMVEGEYDDQLKWPFVGTIIITLLNQLEDKNHRSSTMNLTTEKDMQAGSGRGYDKFISHSELNYDPVYNTQYLKDDTLYFKISASAEVTNYRPWLE